MPTFYAHSAPGDPDPTRWQLLREHLKGVARRAQQLAEATGIPDLPAAAKAAGWLHDLGKYRESFQEFIRGRSPRGSKQHKEAGAAWALEKGHIPLAAAILGHHGGMPNAGPNYGDIPASTDGPDCKHVLDVVYNIALSECPELAKWELSICEEESADTDLFTRVLFACLVDADWTDTSEHERLIQGWPEFPVPPDLRPAVHLKSLLSFIDERAAATRQQNPTLANIRQSILDDCLTAAKLPPGLFSLTVPTGGGKTLSSLAFALKHAATHHLRRVIYVAPYITILDQNADEYRNALRVSKDDLTIFEHQSLSEPHGPSSPNEQHTSAAARRAENWDAPVIVTTNVQFFESLFSNRPGDCRKLHNIAKSVIILDECQNLLPDLVKPTCQMLHQLTATLGCTVLLCTATQPAFDHHTLGNYQLKTREIIPADRNLYSALKRVSITWPTDTRETKERLPWCEVARRMMAEDQSTLCVVNTKKAAIELFRELEKRSPDAFHLSSSMCPAHRMMVLSMVKQRLLLKQPVYVVSTQLIEAGVNIDFPCVFREMAPLESIIQAAGRCNREGLIPNVGGRVVVFRAEEGENRIPNGWYRKGRDVLETVFLAANQYPCVEDPEDIRKYFEHLYWQGELDKHNIVGMRTGLKFESVAKHYKLIIDDTLPVVVANWQEKRDEIAHLLEQLKKRPNRTNFRALAPYQVNVYRNEITRLPKGLAVPINEYIDLLVWHGDYDSKIGRTSDFQDLIEAI